MVIPAPVRSTINTDPHELLMEMNMLRCCFSYPAAPIQGIPVVLHSGQHGKERAEDAAEHLRPAQGPRLPHLLSGSRLGSPTHRSAASPPIQCSQDRVGCVDLDFSR